MHEIRFDEHGSFSVSAEGRILCMSFVGALNEESLRRCAVAMGEALAPLAGKPFAALTDLAHCEAGTPEAVEITFRMLRAAYRAGLQCHAVVADDPLLAGIHRRNLQRLREEEVVPPGIEDRVFATREAALEWLRAAGFDRP